MERSLDRSVLDTLLENLEGDAVSLAELITAYLEDTPRQIEQLELALEKGDASVVERIAHTIKGTSAAFGAEALAHHCQKLERSATTRNPEAVAAAVLSIKAEIPRVKSSLSEYLK
jgi:HPt (histidine-containing phosphotransfer) domain-containing protein